jgi:hypothetical protein
MLQASFRIVIILSFLFMTACETTDSTLRGQGHDEAYVQGFHDGRHSGMKEAGNAWEHYIRDHERYASDEQYAIGWNEGEIEGKHLQVQAQSIGDAMGGAYTGYRVGEEVDKNSPHPKKAAKDAMKGVDPSVFKNLEK